MSVQLWDGNQPLNYALTIPFFTADGGADGYQLIRAAESGFFQDFSAALPYQKNAAKRGILLSMMAAIIQNHLSLTPGLEPGFKGVFTGLSHG